MTPEEIQKLITNEVKKQMKLEKENLAKKINYKLEYTGKFAQAYLLMQVFKDWAR